MQIQFSEHDKVLINVNSRAELDLNFLISVGVRFGRIYKHISGRSRSYTL